MINNNKVIFNVASMPQREKSLHDTVLSVLPQCDELHVYLNDYQKVPYYLYHPKIFYYLSSEHLGDLGDVGKFFRVHNLQGYIFTIDDDLVYPETYADDMIRQIERFNRKAVITAHGRIFHEGRKCTSLYSDFKEGFACTRQSREAFIHLLGTGVTAYHSSTVEVDLHIFEAINMADVWLSLHLQQNNIPIFCIAHEGGYIRESKNYDRAYTIWNFCHGKDDYQTQMINTVNWKLHTCEDNTLHHSGV